MDKKIQDVAVIVAEKAYGAYGKQMLNNLFKKKKEKKQEKGQEASVQEEIITPEPVKAAEMQQPEVTNVSETKAPEVQEQTAPVEETQTAQPVVEEEKAKQQTSDKDVKEEYPNLFSMFTEMMGGEENNSSGDQIFAEMFAMAFGSMMGIDVYKEQLEKAENLLQEKLKKERQAERSEDTQVKESEPAVTTVSAADMANGKSSAELAFDKMAGGKEQVTLADLEKAGVNLKTDLQPTLKALVKDKPEKLTELAPQGLGDKDKPVSKELAVALIERKQQRDIIMRNNMNVRG